MRQEQEKSYRRSLRVGLTVSAVVHVALVAGYAVLWVSPPGEEVAADTEPSIERAAPSLEVVRLPEPEARTTRDETRSSAVASTEPDAASSLASGAGVLKATDLDLRMAVLSASLSRESTVPAGPVTARLDAVSMPTGADGWYPGKYTEEHGDHDHAIVNGRVLGLGPSCSYGSVYTSVNQRSPFGG